jgi:hypothetical protein
LHPVNNELLLGLGQSEGGLVKPELFTIADIDAPYSLGPVVSRLAPTGVIPRHAIIATRLPIRPLMMELIVFRFRFLSV